MVWAAEPAVAQRWQMQYFYDKIKSNLWVADMQFVSASRGVLVGEIVQGKDRRPVAVVTSDGGAHWQTVDLKETPISLFFLNENAGWMVTSHGLWHTAEAGKSWRKVPGLPAGFVRVFSS